MPGKATKPNARPPFPSQHVIEEEKKAREARRKAREDPLSLERIEAAHENSMARQMLKILRRDAGLSAGLIKGFLKKRD
ncbi:MAG TPA: hypothetical protein ENI72_04125 [Rhodospirillales bacterium]|nr:hypothetical protein [Rhodospirillales bacterium]